MSPSMTENVKFLFPDLSFLSLSFSHKHCYSILHKITIRTAKIIIMQYLISKTSRGFNKILKYTSVKQNHAVEILPELES